MEGHNFFVRTPFRVLFDSMEIPLSQYYIHIYEEDSGCYAELLKVKSAWQVRLARLGLTRLTSNFGRSYILCPNSVFGVLGLYGKKMESPFHIGACGG